MPEVIVPESRIFQIGRECYVIYLGNQIDDVRPFVRIGNIRKLSDEVHQVVSTTVITDNHVGNPLLEILYVPRYTGRYIGDTGVVETMKRFFESFELPSDEITDYRKVQPGTGRHMVWFYSSGNIHLRYDNKVLFDLHKVEKKDKHFVRLLDDVKSEFLRNPFRFIKHDFNNAGLILINGNAIWFEGGKFLAVEAHSNFIPKLLSHGIDPDFVDSAIFDLKASGMDSQDAAVFVGMLKRARQRHRQLRAITTEPKLHRKLKFLFPTRGDVPSSLEVLDVSGEKKASFQESAVSVHNSFWRIRHSGLPTVQFGGEINNGLSVNVRSNSLRFRIKSKEFHFDIPNGFPLQLVGENVDVNQIVNRYASYVLNGLREHLEPKEMESAAILDKYLQSFQKDVLSKKRVVSSLLQQNSEKLKHVLRTLKISKTGSSWFYFCNAKSILSLLCSVLPPSSALRKNGEGVLGFFASILSQVKVPNEVLPFMGDLYLGERPVLLWRIVKRRLTPSDMEQARSISSNIHQMTSLDEGIWKNEYNRLIRLIRSLRERGTGPLTQRQLSFLETQASEPKRKTAPREPRKPQNTASQKPVEKKKSIEKSSPIQAQSQPPKKPSLKIATSRVPVKAKKNIWPILRKISIPLLFFLLLGATIWDITGKAPWGRVLKFSRSAPLADRVVEKEEKDTLSNLEQSTNNDENPMSLNKKMNSAEKNLNTDNLKHTDAKEDMNTPYQEEKGAGVALEQEGSSSEEKMELNVTEDHADVNRDGTLEDTEQNLIDETLVERKNERLIPSDTGNVVDVNEVPQSAEDVEDYLDVHNRVGISEIDIHLAANEIAVLNGYKDLDYRVFVGNDPDWIYPGMTLLLPDTGNYNIRTGDTIWFLAAREIRMSIERDLKIYDEAILILDNKTSERTEKESATNLLRGIARDSRASSLRRIAKEALNLR